MFNEEMLDEELKVFSDVPVSEYAADSERLVKIAADIFDGSDEDTIVTETVDHVRKYMQANNLKGESDLFFSLIGSECKIIRNYRYAELAYRTADSIKPCISYESDIAYCMRRRWELDKTTRTAERKERIEEILSYKGNASGTYIGLNKALWMISQGSSDRWELADRIAGELEPDAYSEVMWRCDKDDGNVEGLVVYLLLLRHQILIDYSGVETISELWEGIAEVYDDIPIKMGNVKDRRLLSDFIRMHYGDKLFAYEINQFMRKLPITRKTAYELKEAADNLETMEKQEGEHPAIPIYSYLLDQFRDFLDDEEKERYSSKLEEETTDYLDKKVNANEL